MIVWLAASTALAADTLSLSYEQALEQALAVNPALAEAKLDVDAADGALIAAKASSTCPHRLVDLNQFTSESTREFVRSSYKSLNWQVGMSQYLPTGTNLGVDWTTASTRFKYELRDTGLVVERENPCTRVAWSPPSSRVCSRATPGQQPRSGPPSFAREGRRGKPTGRRRSSRA